MNKSNINALNDTNLVSPHQLILPLNYITVIKEPTPREPSFFIIPFPPRKAVVLTKNISVGLFLEALRLFVFLEALRLFIFLYYLLTSQNSRNCCLYSPAPPLAGWRKVACTSTPYSATVRLAFCPTPMI